MTIAPVMMTMKKQKNIRNNEYLEWIKILPCLVCTIKAGYIPSLEFHSDPHHIPEKGGGSIGLKTHDNRAIPLCRLHHMEYHNLGKETFREKYNLDYEYIIHRLQEAYGRVDKV